MLGESEEDAQDFLDQFTKIMDQIGMPITENKTIGLTQFLIYLGLLLNFLDQVIAIPDDKSIACLELLDDMITAYRSQKTILIQDLQKLACHLNFICQAIPTGSTFLGGIYTLLAQIKKESVCPGHHRRVNKELHNDLVMFRSFFDDSTPDFVRTIPFMIRRGVNADTISFYANSAGAANLGFGCTFGNK